MAVGVHLRASDKQRGRALWITSDSRLAFAVPGLLRTQGQFAHVAGTVTADERGTPLSLEVTIAARSLRTGLAPRDLHLRTAGFLDVRRYPIITYRAEQFKQVRPGHYHVRGRLRLRGRDLPVTLQAALAPDDTPDHNPAERHAHVIAVLPRSAFDIPHSAIIRVLLRPLIADEVTVTADVYGTLVGASAAAAAISAGPSRRSPSGPVS